MKKNLLESAIEYAEKGFPVFPLSPGSKKPFEGSNGFKDATTDEEQIIEWWSATPDANIGIATEGLVVIDVDGADNSWLRDESNLLTELGQNAICVTPRGGAHYYFTQFPNQPVSSSGGKVAPNVDIRADGGYVVAPPSYVKDDEKGIEGDYRWCFPLQLEMRSELTPLPTWMYRAIYEGHTPTQEVLQSGNMIPMGQRNVALTRLAGVVRRYGCNEGEIRAFIRTVNSQRCAEPLSNTEVDGIARSVSRYAPDQTSVAMVENWSGQDMEKPDVDPGGIPKELMQVPGLIGEIIEYNLATAFKKQPELALAAALCLMSVITGRRVEDNYGTRTNLYVFGVAGSGAGKEHARKLNKKILTLAGGEDYIGAEGFASHAGIISAVEDQPAILFQIDEFGRLLKTLKNPGSSPHLYGIITNLLKLYTSANSQFVGDAYADTSKIKRIKEPHAVVYGTTVPESFFEGLTIESLSDGFLSRTLCFFSEVDLPEPTPVKRQEMPETIIEQVRAWLQFQPGGNLASVNPQPYEMEMTDEAFQIFTEVEKSSRERQVDKQDQCRSIWSRLEEKARTLAMIYACSRDGVSNPIIDEDAASWGATLADLLTRQLIYRARQWVSSGVNDSKIKEIYRIILAAGQNGISQTALTRKLQKYPARERNELLHDMEINLSLIQSETESHDGPGRSKTTYFADRYVYKNIKANGCD